MSIVDANYTHISHLRVIILLLRWKKWRDDHYLLCKDLEMIFLTLRQGIANQTIWLPEARSFQFKLRHIIGSSCTLYSGIFLLWKLPRSYPFLPRYSNWEIYQVKNPIWFILSYIFSSQKNTNLRTNYPNLGLFKVYISPNFHTCTYTPCVWAKWTVREYMSILPSPGRASQPSHINSNCSLSKPLMCSTTPTHLLSC